MSSVKNLIPTLDVRTPSPVCQDLPIPGATAEIEVDIRSDVEIVCQRQEGGPDRQGAGNRQGQKGSKNDRPEGRQKGHEKAS